SVDKGPYPRDFPRILPWEKPVCVVVHCKIRVGKGIGTSFWKDLWIGDNLLKLSFPCLFALEENKDISVADKMNTSISSSFRRHVRGGVIYNTI
ncbi:hypothetical protein Tco_0466796, partial [Tanacetum coccineum]